MKKTNKKRELEELENSIATCNSIPDILRLMNSVSEKFKSDCSVTVEEILSLFARRILDINNRQAVFGDALKRALKMLVKRLDTADALTSTLASYVETSILKPLTFNETDKFEEFVTAIDKFNSK